MDLRTATVPALSAVAGLVHGLEQRAPRDGAEARADALARVARALDGRGRLLLLRQVHGARVVEAPWDGAPEADASVASSPGLILGIQTADCLPVLLVDPRRRAVAAAHAGWKGTAAGIATRAVEALVGRGSDPRDLVAAIGPGIGPCCYEVGEELRDALGPSAAPFFRPGPNGRPHLDLRALNARQLEAAGLAAGAIHHVADCTRCRADLYHS
jgi:YfiH family protein